MAQLLPCPNCKKEISENAHSCPHCGEDFMAYVQRNEKDTSQWSNSAFDTPAIQREWNVTILDIFKNNMQIIIWIVASVGVSIIGVKFDLETFPLFVYYFIVPIRQ